MATETRPSVTPQLVIGVFFTLLGVVLTLDRLQHGGSEHLRPLWPLFLVAVGTRSCFSAAIGAAASGAFLDRDRQLAAAEHPRHFFGSASGELIGPDTDPDRCKRHVANVSRPEGAAQGSRRSYGRPRTIPPTFGGSFRRPRTGSSESPRATPPGGSRCSRSWAKPSAPATTSRSAAAR